MLMISAFGDEIADDLAAQLQVLNELNIPGLDLRAAWGKNVLTLTDEEANRARKLCDGHQVTIPCLGSPVGKSPLADPVEKELANLDRLYQIADILGTRNIRIFSFYPPKLDSDDHSEEGDVDQYVDEAIERLNRMADSAQKHGFMLLLENEKGIVGDTIARCHRLMTGVQSDYLQFLWDPANFVQVGETQVTQDGWPLLGSFVGYVHIKDASLAERKVRPAGQGDGQISELLTHLKQSGYAGVLSLEPHLVSANHSNGYSGPQGMAVAVEALRQVMFETGCEERSE